MLRRSIWIGLSAVFAVVVFAAAWTGWQAYRVNQDLSAAVDDATALRGAVTDGDDAATQPALDDLQAHSAAAAERTDGITWRLLAHAPVVGDDARGVAAVSDVVADLSADGIEPLLQTTDRLDSILPRDARVDVGTLASLQGSVDSGLAAFDRAEERLRAEDPSGYVERFKTKYRDLQDQVSDAADLLGSADTAVRVMPSMLGAAGPRDYLLVFQNNAELRSTGGLPGAVSLVHAEDGKVEMTRQVAANTFGGTDRPVLPLTTAERKIYGDVLGTFFLDANMTPDFPRTAELMRARWEQEYPERVDGVLSIDPVALSYLLDATGPVEVGGTTLTADNTVDELLHEVYLRYDDPADQDAWFRKVARAVFDRVSSGVESPQDLIRALSRASDESRLYLHSFDEDTQAALAGSQVAGELVTDPTAPPQVGVYLNDTTGSKMSYYLRYHVHVTATSCSADDAQTMSGSVRLHSDAPADAASLPAYITGAGAFGTDPGSQLVALRLYGPVAGKTGRVLLNGKPAGVAAAIDQDGRPVSTLYVELAPDQTVDVTWTTTSGPHQPGNPQVSVTPGVVADSSPVKVSGACA